MHNHYSTHLIPQRERQNYWRGLIDETYFPLELGFRDAHQFQGHLSRWPLGRLAISRLESSATCYRRTARQIDHSSPYFLITLPEHAPVRFSQAGRTVVCHPGAFILERNDQPYEFSYGKENALWVMRVPIELLKTRLREPERFLYMEFDRRQGLGNLFYSFMRNLVQQLDYTDETTHDLLANQLIDLLAHSLERDERFLMSHEAGLRSAHLRNIESFVRENIRRADLSPEVIAAACQISTRYLHKLFRGSGQTVSQWIRELRLQSAFNDIAADRGFSTLAEISYRWGFNDQTHFCRLFKNRFGCTPKEVRERS